MKKFYNIYQYIAFLVIFPLSSYLWYLKLKSFSDMLAVISLPVLTAYVIPALGTNVTKLWAFNTRFKIGNFRFYHGFVLGASINIFGLMLWMVSPTNGGIAQTVFFALISGGFIGFINWIYDIYAIKTGFIVLFNKEAHDNKSAHEIAAAYAPVYFFVFGAVYGVFIKVMQHYFENRYDGFAFVLAGMYVVALTVPTLVYAAFSYIRTGEFGVSAYKGGNES